MVETRLTLYLLDPDMYLLCKVLNDIYLLERETVMDLQDILLQYTIPVQLSEDAVMS